MLHFDRCIRFCNHYHNQDTERSWQPKKFSLPSCCLVAKLCLTLCDPMSCSTPGFRVLHCLLEFAQTHVHWTSDAIQPPHPLSPPSSRSLSLSQQPPLSLGATNLLSLNTVFPFTQYSIIEMNTMCGLLGLACT